MTAAVMNPRRMMDRIILYGAVVGALAAIFGALKWTGHTYATLDEAVEQVPKIAADVAELREWRQIQDERTYNIEWWLSKMGEKAGVAAPPPRRHRGY